MKYIRLPKSICIKIETDGIVKKDGTKFTPSECEDVIFAIKQWCGLLIRYK